MAGVGKGMGWVRQLDATWPPCSSPSQDVSPDIGVESVKRLLEAVDEWIPDPVREVDKPFLLPVEGIYSIPGRGTVVTGRVERGQMRKGDAAEFVGLKSQIKTTITGEECLAASWFSLLPPSIRLPSLSSFPPPSDLFPLPSCAPMPVLLCPCRSADLPSVSGGWGGRRPAGRSCEGCETGECEEGDGAVCSWHRHFSHAAQGAGMLGTRSYSAIEHGEHHVTSRARCTS